MIKVIIMDGSYGQKARGGVGEDKVSPGADAVGEAAEQQPARNPDKLHPHPYDGVVLPTYKLQYY